MIKITCSDFFENGLSFNESLLICKMLEQSGIDAIEVSGNIHGKAQKMIGQEFDGHKILKGGYFYEYAKEISDAVSVPVYVTGGFSDPQLMEKYMKESAISGFGMSMKLKTNQTLHFTYPIAVIILVTVFFGNKINKKQISCTALCIIGIALMCKTGDKAYILGIVLAVISGLAYSVYIVFLGKNNLSSVPALTLSFWLSLFAAVEIGVISVLMGKMSFTISRQGWIAEFMLALFSTVFALILFQKGLFLCGEIRASLLSTFEPITSVIVGIVVFDEKITLKIILGIVAILLSTIFLVTGNNNKN